MGRTRVPTEGRAGELIDELRIQHTILCAAQAKAAELMVEFADVRRPLDKQRIAKLKREGVDPRFEAGEFAALEISAAVNAAKYTVQRLVAMARRLHTECPDAYDAWKAGNICQERAVRINRALRRLVLDSSKQLLNATVVDVAAGQTPELLGRWLNQFVARIEPDKQDERLHRALEDRYASIRPDLDGMSFLSALMSSIDAAAIDRILTALAAAAAPDDLRTMQQRRSDALVDMLCGRISNGCHVVWDANTDTDDHLDDESFESPVRAPDGGAGIDDNVADIGAGAKHNSEAGTELAAQPDRDERDVDDSAAQQPDEPDHGVAVANDIVHNGNDFNDNDFNDNKPNNRVDRDSDSDSDWDSESDCDWETTDWVQPASVFRPDPRNELDEISELAQPRELDPRGEPDTPLPPEIVGRTTNGSWRVTPCPGDHQINPAPVTVGVVVSLQSLFGFSNTPGQLMDRSALVAADQIRDLAQQQGTLFYRLLTDEEGHLLDVSEIGRFPSRKLAMSIKFRDGMCTGPSCHKAAADCDMDHVVPHPEGPTTGINLNNACKPEHRAKTFAGHVTARTGPHTTTWTTPTGHTYTSEDPALPVEEWARHRSPQQRSRQGRWAEE